jgi:CubicO group peptidase (beta-lactamase class C family)
MKACAVLALAACGAAHVATPAAAPKPTPAPAAPDPHAARLDGIMQKVMTSAKPLGVAVGIVHDGQPLLLKAYGFADFARTRPLAIDDELAIGSLTKQFTAAAVMTLVEAGKVKLDDPVATYVPAITAPITVRELLNQTTGLPDFAIPDNMTVPHAVVTAWIAKTSPSFTPGTKHEYSNTNYWLLARVVEAASGASYDDYLRAHVLAPAGLTATHPCSAPAKVEGSAHGILRIKPWDAFDIRGYDGAGDLCSTVHDLLRWQAALFGGKVVDAASFAFMTTPPTLPGGAATDYAAGLVQTTLGTHRAIWHNGEVTGGFESMLFVLPDDHVTVVILTNTASTDAMMTAIIARVLASNAVAPIARDLPVDPGLPERLAGTYQEGGSTFTLRAADGGVVMSSDQREGRLLYQGDGTFVSPWDASIEIHVGNGEVEFWQLGAKLATATRATTP